jgi:two-component system KDP operon response regulator KdpE
VTHVLVVDDDAEILRAVAINLRARGYDVTSALDGASALRAISTRPVDLVIVDLGLPGLSGLEVIAAIRGWSTVPILVLSGRSGAADKIEALDAGADDYLTKPFNVEEMLARLRALSRRAGDVSDVALVMVGAASVDLANHTITRDGVDVHLTSTEWRLLETMVREPGKLLTRRYLLDAVWGPGADEHANYLRIYMGRLRRKLEADAARPRSLLNEHGMGYRFVPSE